MIELNVLHDEMLDIWHVKIQSNLVVEYNKYNTCNIEPQFSLFRGTMNGNGNYSPYSNGHSYVSARPNSPQGPSLEEVGLSMSPPATPEAKNTILKPRGLEQRARMNVG